MNKIDKLLFDKVVEKLLTNPSNDNSIICIFKSANKVFVKDELVVLDRTSSSQVLENRLSRLNEYSRMNSFEKQGDKRTFKVLFPSISYRHGQQVSLF